MLGYPGVEESKSNQSFDVIFIAIDVDECVVVTNE